MNTLKKLLMGFGALFIGFIVFFTVLESGSKGFKVNNEALIVKFMSDLTASWDMQDVASLTSNEFMEQLITAEGRHYLKVFSAMGAVESISDMELADLVMDARMNTGLFIFKAQFEQGPALVKVILVEKSGESRIQALDIIPANTPELETTSSSNLRLL